MKYFSTLCYFTLLTLPFSALAQNKWGFKVFTLTDNYTENSKSFIRAHDVFEDIKLLGGYMIDPYKLDIVDLKSVEKYLKILYPNSSDKGTICIDLENEVFHNLNLFPKHNARFIKSVNDFSKIVLLIKRIRPYLKVGIYGIPFRVYYRSQIENSTKNKFDDILKICDYISPSLYILFPDREKGREANIKYFDDNLRMSLEYGIRLNKPVIPFIWYAIHPSNKKYGRNLIEKQLMLSYIEYLRNFSLGNTRVSGLIWYDGAAFRPVKDKNVKVDKNEILQEYMKTFLGKTTVKHK